MSRLLIFGSSGQLANELAGLAVEADHDVRALGRAELDLGDPALDLDAAVAAYELARGVKTLRPPGRKGYFLGWSRESDPSPQIGYQFSGRRH